MKATSKKKAETSMIQCGLCRNPIIDLSSVFQSKSSFIPICKKCKCKFSTNDIEMTLNIFAAYGGYFGKENAEQFSVKEWLSKTLKNRSERDPNLINMRLMHQALLHGYTPSEYIEKLKDLL
jgi:hypothetical protein